MQFSRKSFSNLAALAQGDSMSELQGGGPLSHDHRTTTNLGSGASLDGDVGKRTQR
jgi:hypothetical protein